MDSTGELPLETSAVCPLPGWQKAPVFIGSGQPGATGVVLMRIKTPWHDSQ